jgi:lipopolysaccharide export system ATP-binding protein
MPVLQAVCLIKSFRRRAVVYGVSLEVRSGEVVGLLGRNGAGKTTTFQMMVGLLRPDRGQILLDGTDISRLPTHERAALGVTYLPQEGSVFLKATTADNLRLILELKGRSRSDVEAAGHRLLKELGLSALASQPAHTLSGGERRRLEICRALVLQPKFLLLDEPFTGVDPLTVVEIQRILLALRDRGIGIVVSDHNVRDTFKVVSRATIIDEGQVLVEGSPDELAADDLARDCFLGHNFRLGGEIPTAFGR